MRLTSPPGFVGFDFFVCFAIINPHAPRIGRHVLTPTRARHTSHVTDSDRTPFRTHVGERHRPAAVGSGGHEAVMGKRPALMEGASPTRA
jgi:hypothetical protein